MHQQDEQNEPETHGERTEQEIAEKTLRAPVVIVGAGPTGLMAANLLGMAGIQTLLLERNESLTDSPRAISIDDEGLRICQAVGLSDEVMQHMLLDIDACYVSDKSYLARVSPTSRRNGYPFISTFHQPTFEATLLNGLERFSCVSVYFQYNLASFEQDDEGVTLLIYTPDKSTLRIRCRYLLACDGGQSEIRHVLHIPMRAPSLLPSWLPRPHLSAHEAQTLGKLAQRWISVDCVESTRESDSLPRDIGYFFSDYQRPAMSAPTPFGGRRWEFMIHPHEQPEKMLDDNMLYTLMEQALERAPGDICAHHEHDEGTDIHVLHTLYTQRPRIIRRTFYTFRTAIAETFSQGRVFLLGDAAHLMPPFAGQGMNSGLRDAHNLAWKLRLVLCENAHPHLLETYFEERISHVTRMTLFTSLPGRLLTTTVRPYTLLRNSLFRILNRIPLLRSAITEMRVKPASRYAHGFFLSSNRGYKKYAGHLLPQSCITTTEGQYLLLDEVLGDGFALLTCCEDAQDIRELSLLLQDEAWEKFQIRAINLRVTKQSADVHCEDTKVESVIIAEDAFEQPFPLLRCNSNLCLLVRPDRYILTVFDRHHAREAAIALDRLLHDGR